MQADGASIYVAGNPELYPMEYYDPESGTYQGAIPDFLRAFARDCGYELRYLQPGPADRRAELAERQQVDLISGCADGSRYAHTDGEPVILFVSGAGGEETAVQLWFTQVSPGRFQADLRGYAARISQEEWIGSILRSAGDVPPRQLPMGLLWGGGLLLLALAAALAVCLYRLRRARRRRIQAVQADPETGLGTEEVLRQAFHSLGRNPGRSALCLICFRLDLDRAGYLWGREQAHALLLHGARVLREAAGQADVLIRTGRDDLIVLKRFPNRQDAEEWTRSAVEKLRAFTANGAALRRRDASAGICPLGPEYHELGQALFHARQCALAAGLEESDFRLCGTAQCGSCQERWRLLSDFSGSLQQGDFLLYIQFFVDAHSFRIVGGEALSRWRHPRLGFLSPNRYIPLLEGDGRIRELDCCGLEQACGFLEALCRHPVQDFFLSCNFSRSTFAAPGFVERCTQIMDRYAFPRKLLILEVTETPHLDPEGARQMLRNIVALREYGVRVIFDDFGVGFSSFHDLQDYPMDGLKLDKELVDNMQTERGRILLNALVETGHRLGLTILAEGVEEDYQIETLQKLHCDVLQGFRFCVPLPAAEAGRRILEQARPGACADSQEG